MRRARRLLSPPFRKEKKLVVPVVAAAVTVFAALGAVPARASQAAPARTAPAALSVPQALSSGAASSVFAHLLDGRGDCIRSEDWPNQFGIVGAASVPSPNCELFNVNEWDGAVRPGWPFSDTKFNTLYAGYPVVQFQQTTTPGGCMQTDSLHSGVFADPCTAHDAGTYWVIYGNGGSTGICSHAYWLVNVGITNHYDPYPHGYAMFLNSNDLIYTASGRPISIFNQWCLVS
jgi:hypothetical protein